MRPNVLAAASVLSLVGCASAPPQMDRNEYLAATSRVYKAPKEQVLAAAEKVLHLADGSDFKFAHNSEGFNASRQWSVYMVLAAVFGNDYWTVKVTEGEGTSRVEAQVGTTAQPLAPVATTNPNTWSATTLPGGATPVTGPALYELFFARVDYMLGLRPEWPTCKWSDERVSSKATWGINEALCNSFNMKDETPKAPMVAGRSEPSKVLPPPAEPASATAHPKAPATPVPAALPAPPKQTAPTGQDSYQVQQMAKASSCAAEPLATLTAKGPGFENYSVTCADGDVQVYRCEFGNCRVLK